MGKLTNKVALVTGGNSGIGLATAKLYKEEGAQVIITARSQETFAKAKQEYGSVFDVVQTDVSKLEDLDRLYAHIKSKYGKLDVIFANAGVALFSPTTEVTPEFFDNQFNTNVKGLFAKKIQGRREILERQKVFFAFALKMNAIYRSINFFIARISGHPVFHFLISKRCFSGTWGLCYLSRCSRMPTKMLLKGEHLLHFLGDSINTPGIVSKEFE